MRRIPLRARDGSVRAYTTVDDEDYTWAMQWRWQLQVGGHVARRDNSRAGGGRTVLLHRAIMERMLGRPLRVGELVHHAHERPRDNRRGRLELLSGRSEHAKLHWSGVRPHREANPRRGIARVPSGRYQLIRRGRYRGTFDTEEEAVRHAASLG